MYGRGNYVVPLGQGPYTNAPPFHQRPLAPPPPQVSQHHPLLPSTVQQGPTTISSQVGQLGHIVYPQATPGVPQQGPSNPVFSSATNSQPYLTSTPPSHPPQPLPGHGTSQTQQHSHWTPNASFVPPRGFPSAPRILPQPPSQGQAPFSNQVRQPAAAGVQAPAPPHPQASRFYSSPPVGSFERLIPLSNNASVGPPLPPPPLPPLPTSLPGSPPIPPSSSPPCSSSTLSKNHMATPIPVPSESAFRPSVSSGVSKSISHEITAPGSVGGVSVPSLDSNCDGAGGMGSTTHGELLSPDLPPAPPKPADDNIVSNIELLCQFIARNGPQFETMTRHREVENPKFKFLFGGEPGSEAAVAHEYFIWTKRKYNLESRPVGKLGSSSSPLRQSEGFLSQQGTTTDAAVPGSPADSDMDMEDDITHPPEEPQSSSSEKQSRGYVSLSSALDKEQELHPFLGIAEPRIAKDAVDENLTDSQDSEFGSTEQRQDQDEATVDKSVRKVDALDTHSSGDVGLPITVNTAAAAVHEGLSRPTISVEPAEIRLEKLPNLLVKHGSSPFRLLSHYTSDEGPGDGDGHVDEMPTASVPSVEVGSTTFHKDDGADLGTDHGNERVLESDEELEQLAQSSKSHSSAKAKSENLVDNRCRNQEPLKDDIPQKEPQQLLLVRDDSVGRVKSVEKKNDLKNGSSMLKVDEFGRLLREDDSDSDLIDSPRRRRRKRSRSRTRSRSPDRRRRRSPRRKIERRGRSRSFSPKRRRSRSKSPPSRHGGDTIRREKRPECFDFIKGKCYRGASCRYLHHEEKSDRSRSHRSRQQFQDSSRTSGVHERFETPYKKSSSEINQGRNQELKCVDNLPITEEKNSIKEVMDGTTAHFLEKSGDLEPSVRLMTSSNVGNAADGRPPAIENLELQQSQSHSSNQFTWDADHQHQHIDAYPSSESAPMATPSSFTSPLPADKKSGPTVPDHLSNLPPSFPSVAVVTSSSFNKEMPRDTNLTSSAAEFPSTRSVESFVPYQVPYTHAQFSFPPHQSWNSLPPPPAQPHPPRPTFMNDTYLTPRLHGAAAVHFTPNMLSLRSDFYSETSVRPYLSEFPQPSNVVQNQGGPSLAGEDRLTGRPGPSAYPSSSYGQESSLAQPVSFPEKSISVRPSFPGENLPPAGGISALHGEHIKQSSSLPGCTPDFERNQPSMSSDRGVSRISNHFNPYASTFEQPHSSKFISNVLVQEKEKAFSSSTMGTASGQIPVEGIAFASLDPLQQGKGVLSHSGGDQYDPLFDSIDPSSNTLRKSHNGQKLEITDESDDMLRFSGSNKPLDGEEKKQKLGGLSDISGSLENDEFGETADAEVGAIENGSPSNPLDAADTGGGEVEIDQVKYPGKSKKNKESRSMRLFKIAIANFVKEVLKPSWRQGNMSKEAFKTIVKKTVDRVSGAMKSHQIPKSQAKINHYIDSSQRKLTKLVMGYVDKYVKV